VTITTAGSVGGASARQSPASSFVQFAVRGAGGGATVPAADGVDIDASAGEGAGSAALFAVQPARTAAAATVTLIPAQWEPMLTFSFRLTEACSDRRVAS
jgi:hypothetical protein